MRAKTVVLALKGFTIKKNLLGWNVSRNINEVKQFS